MVLKESEIKRITNFVKTEPRTVQEISKLIKKSWVTTDSYVKQIKENTGLIGIKNFRKGTKAALKIVYYNHNESLASDDLKEDLFHKIKKGRNKSDFDFMDIFQFIPPKRKQAFTEDLDKENISNTISFYRKAIRNVYCYSGNLSFINLKEKNKSILSIFKELLERKVNIKVLCRINMASLANLNKLNPLISNYPGLIEIRHCYQPLRGVIIDDSIARFKDEEKISKYRKGELNKNLRIIYEIKDPEWISWLQKVFWNMFRFSIDYDQRIRELKKIF